MKESTPTVREDLSRVNKSNGYGLRCKAISERTFTEKSVSLNFLFNNLDFSGFWSFIRKKYALNGWTRTLDWKAMIKALILKEMWQIGSRRKLVRLLESDEHLLKLCGFEKPPNHSTFSKFLNRVGSDVFMDIFYEMVKQLASCVEIGKVVAIDSTLFKAYSRDWKKRENADPDAKWGYSATKKMFIFGYKVHLACDAESELPLAFTVTPANIYDSTEYLPVMDDLMKRGIIPKVVLADAGYDTKANILQTLERFKATPIISLNPRNSKGKERDWERDLPVKRRSDEWKQLSKKRGSVERVFSRLKEELDLKAVKVRGLEKVKIHVTLSMITMLSVALIAIMSNNEVLSISINSFRY